MSFRIFEGNVLSLEGWRMCNADECVWAKIPGADVTIQVRSGIPAIILPAFVARYNQLVEPVRDPDTACWTLTNDVSTSNHPAGVAVDINWSSHAFHAYGTFGDRLPMLRQVQQEFRGCIQWGGDWGGNPQDEMHHELSHPEGYLDDNGNFVLAVDQRLIDLAKDLQAGYLGIYVPGVSPTPPTTPAQPLSRADGYAVKIIQEGQRRNITPRGIEIALATGLVESNLTIYANAKVPASMDIPHDAVGSDGYSVGIFQQQVRDTGGGWWWGDAATCMDPTSSAGLFYDHLVRLDYNGSNSPGSYAQAVQQSAFPDRYDQRFNDAVAIYNRLANVTTDQGDDDLSAEAERMIKELYDEYRKEKQGASRSFMVPDGNPVDSPLGFLWNIDGNVENINITLGYLFGTTLAEEFVNTVASTGVAPASWAGNVNQAWLQQYGQQWCLGLISFRAAIQKAFKAAGAAPAGVVQSADQALTEAFSTEVAAKTASAVGATVWAAVQQAPVPAVVAPVELATTPTDEASNIADLYRSLKSLGLADALPIEGRAPLAALISILQTKNGTQLGATS